MEFKVVLGELAQLMLKVLTQVPTTVLQFKELAQSALEERRARPAEGGDAQ